MCRNSKNGAKNIVVLCFVFVLLASPCFARASWGGLFSTKETTVSSAEVLKESVSLSPEEFSQVVSTELSEKTENVNYEELMSQYNALEKAFTESELRMQNVENWYNNLVTQLDNYAQSDKISEAEYQSVVDMVGSLADMGDKQISKIDEQNEKIAQQDAEIAKLKKASGTVAYGKFNALVGFENAIPNWSLGLALGTKFKNGMMLEMGANYRVGDLNDKLFNLGWDIDRLSVNASIGWTF